VITALLVSSKCLLKLNYGKWGSNYNRIMYHSRIAYNIGGHGGLAVNINIYVDDIVL